jgi:hypothetical protein
MCFGGYSIPNRVGRVDRIQTNEDGSRMLVEIKNRANGFFNKVRDYEEVQCRVYLEMLGDVEYCRLVETYEGESKSYLHSDGIIPNGRKRFSQSSKTSVNISTVS